jgi:hypothetical protein
LVNTLVFDYLVRSRFGGLSLIWSVLAEIAVPSRFARDSRASLDVVCSLSLPSVVFSPQWLTLSFFAQKGLAWRGNWCNSDGQRVVARALLDAVQFVFFELDASDVRQILAGSDFVDASSVTVSPKGFWRVDKDKDPELRHTVLTLIAFHDLEAKIREHGGDRDAGIAAFLAQNHGEGWLLPETLRLADYGLGHDERAQHHQPVASRLGPRFYDWQLTQSAEESWRECHLHARNLLGETGYRNLLADIEAERSGTRPISAAPPPVAGKGDDTQQMNLFN